ncbi:MAG: DUF1579 family protein [Alphaproteobacteria bacterium]|nr:DUF1579 family protein [Alphaproteobacteria bacterium]
MKRFTLASLVLMFTLSGWSSTGFAAEKTFTKSQGSKSHIEMLDEATVKKLHKDGAASERNFVLMPMLGRWEFDLKFWSQKDASPQLSTGYVVNTMILDNRFMSSEMNVILNIGGQNIPYEGQGYIGFDTVKKTFTSVWLDTTSTGIRSGTGKYDEKTNILEEKGRFTFPLLEGERVYRSELDLTGSETFKMTIYIADKAGKEYKAIEIDFHRKS